MSISYAVFCLKKKKIYGLVATQKYTGLLRLLPALLLGPRLAARSGSFFFFNATATTEIYTLSLHDALPICSGMNSITSEPGGSAARGSLRKLAPRDHPERSEEHTSELQSHVNLVCRLLLEKKKKNKNADHIGKKKKKKQ